MQRTRRRVLELGGAALATGFAGCLGGSGSVTDTPDATDSGTATDGGGEATPTASPTSSPTATGYAFLGITPAQLVELSEALGEGATDALTRETAVPGIDTLAEATVVLQFARSAQLFAADFDRATAESEFEDLGFSAADTYRGYTLFTAGEATAGSATRAAGVSDDAIVLVGRYSSEEEVDKRPALETIIDAKSGNTDRYTDAVPDCGRLVDALGNAHVLAGRTHETGATFEGATGERRSTRAP